MEPTHDNWKKVEENLKSLFGTVFEQCQSILSLSYNYLPQYLRAYFLYIGGFPEDTEIDVSQLIRLWMAEQFIKSRSNKRLEVVAEDYLQELIDRSLILTGRSLNGRFPSCKIHDLLRQLCLRETHTENVVHIMNGNVPEVIYDQRRVILLPDLHEKQVYPIRHNSGIIRTFISMKYFSSDFSERIFSIVSQLKLLKVLDVLSALDDFSSVIPQLVHLRYVAARIKGALSLAKLRNLQTIILISEERVLNHPLDIWTVSEIRHVDIGRGLYIYNPVEVEKSLFLNNLQTLYLLDSPFVAEIIRRTPNLKELSFVPGDKADYFDSLNLLEKLETQDLLGGEATIDRMIFPPNLKELTLESTRIPWEVVNLLANYLPNLEVLEVDRAFTGTYWKLDEDVVFHKLKYLKITIGDLKRWEAGSDNFPILEQLQLRGLHKLKEIPESIGEIMTLKLIEIYKCSSALVNSAKRIQQEQESLGTYELQVPAIWHTWS